MKIKYLFLIISTSIYIGEIHAQSPYWVGGFYNKIGVEKLVISPNGTIYAGTFGWGIFRSTNGGLDWNQSNEGIPKDLIDLWVSDIAIDSNNHIYAATFGAGVFSSSDDGLHWNPTNNGITNMYANCLVIAPNGHLFVGTNSGLFQSSDFGNHWSAMNQGIPTGVITSMVATPNGDLFTGYGYSVDNYYVYRSTDNGVSWSQSNNDLNYGWPTVCFAVDLNGDLYVGKGGVYRSTNNGNNWTQLVNGPLGVVVYSLAIDSSDAILASTSHGIFRTTDHGNQWSIIGLTTTEVRAMMVKPNGEIFAGPEDRRGVFRSSDSGGTWQYISMGNYDKWSQTKSIAVSAPNIFAGSAAGVLRSIDEGTSWFSVGLLQDTVLALSLDSAGSIIAGTQSGKVFTSTMSDSIWNLGNGLPDDPVLSITADISGNLYAGTASRTVFHSIDHGTHWSYAGFGLPYSSVLSLATNQLGFLFAGTADSGVFKSSDRGLSWSPVNNGITNLHVAAISIDDLSKNKGSSKPLYAGTEKGVFLSTNNGTTWSSFGLNTFSISSLMTKGDTVIAGTNGNGIYRFPDTTGNWGVLGYPNNMDKFVTALGIIRPIHYFAATVGTGVFEMYDILPTPPIVSVKQEKSFPALFALYQNYPNPFNPSTVITFSLPCSGLTTIRIFNVLGQEIATLVNGTLPAGKHSVSWFAQNYPSGVYFYRLRSASFIETKKLVLMR